MFTTLKTWGGIALFAVLLACSAATWINYIQVALNIALQVADISGTLPPIATTYISTALNGLACASDEGATMDPPVIKATKITSCLAGVSVPVLPPGTPQAVVTKIGKLADAIQQVLSSLPNPRLVAATTTANKHAQALMVSPGQRVQLQSMSAQARAAAATLKK